jgi:hypothetical protein
MTCFFKVTTKSPDLISRIGLGSPAFKQLSVILSIPVPHFSMNLISKKRLAINGFLG